LRPPELPAVPNLLMTSLSPCGLRHSPPLVTPVRSRHGAFVPAIRPKGSYGMCTTNRRVVSEAPPEKEVKR
jgi:hypothetical protein